MTPHRAFFGDAEHPFALTGPQIVELERKTGAGIGSLCTRVFNGSFAYGDITETIRLALIGGGLDPQEAAALTNAYVPMRPIAETMALVVEILSGLYFGTATSSNGEEIAA